MLFKVSAESDLEARNKYLPRYYPTSRVSFTFGKAIAW